MRHAVSLLGLTFATSLAQADIYKCVDEYGRATYSNVQSRGCVRIIASPESSAANPPASPAKVPSGRRSGTPADFPRVDPGTQRSRDDGRRRILDNELASEQKSLDEARKQLADKEIQRVTPAELQSGRDRIALHERNIEALRKELSALK